MTPLTDLQEQIKALSKERRVTEISHKTGIRHNTLWRQINGLTKIKLETCIELEKAGYVKTRSFEGESHGRSI